MPLYASRHLLSKMPCRRRICKVMCCKSYAKCEYRCSSCSCGFLEDCPSPTNGAEHGLQQDLLDRGSSEPTAALGRVVQGDPDAETLVARSGRWMWAWFEWGG